MFRNTRYIHPSCLITITACLFFHFAIGQTDTVLLLREIEVTAERMDFTDVGKHSQSLDTTWLLRSGQHNLANLLAAQTPLYIRSYGNGTLATLGIRGGSASHTQVLWNGIPLRNPMIGMIDLALIPSWLVDQASIHYGGHGAAFGSGAIGGLISVNNAPLESKAQALLQVSGGSWDQRSGMVRLAYGFKNLRFSTRVYSMDAENNYRYKPGHDLPVKFQSNHHVLDQGALQEIRWTLNEQQNITGRVWYQYADRQIPPTSTQTTSKAAQQDENLRTALQWSFTGNKVKWQIKTAFLDEKIDYQDSLILLYTSNRFRTWLAEAGTALPLGPEMDLAAGVYTERVTARSNNYLEEKTRNQQAVFASLRWIRPQWLWRFQLREERTDNVWSPCLVDVSAEWSGWNHLIWKASLSRNYRIPTMNDLYWRPGGNPDLVPERGWTLESGLHYKLRQARFKGHASMTGYIRILDQWIMWMPPVKDIRTYWSPVNVTKVNSHGCEWRADGQWSFRNWKLHVETALDLTWSEFGDSLSDIMIHAGDQLFYIPVENGMVRLSIANAHWSGYYSHHWFGNSPGINENLEAGNVASAGMEYQFGTTRWLAACYLQADNVWDVPYRLIERRPMPGRGFEFGIRILL